MFEEIFFPRTAERYRAAPLVEQRERYLVHLRETGARRATLRKCANDQLSLVRLLNLKEGEQSAAFPRSRPWPRSGRSRRDAGVTGRHLPRRERVLSATASNGCAFWAGSMKPNEERHPHQRRGRDIRRMDAQRTRPVRSDHTRLLPRRRPILLLAGRKRHAAGRGPDGRHRRCHCGRAQAGSLEPKDDARLRAASEGVLPLRRGARLVPGGAGRGDHGASVHGGRDRAEGREARRRPAPAGSVQGDRPVDKRDRAILMLFVAYGLRAGEVAGLRLDDLDWENEIDSRSLPEARTDPSLAALAGGRQRHSPLHTGSPSIRSSGAASSSHRTRPIRPLGRKTLGKIVRDRLAESASSPVDAERMRCGMRRPSIFWIRACR